jgi:hypothetical protein
MNGDPVGAEDPGDASDVSGDAASIGWLRAVVTAAAVLVLGYVLFAWLPNYLLGHLSGMDRGKRVAVATTEFLAALVVFAWGLRRLQAKGII